MLVSEWLSDWVNASTDLTDMTLVSEGLRVPIEDLTDEEDEGDKGSE